MELEIGGKCKKWKRDRQRNETDRQETDRQAGTETGEKKTVFEKKKEKKTFYIKEERTDKEETVCTTENKRETDIQLSQRQREETVYNVFSHKTTK